MFKSSLAKDKKTTSSNNLNPRNVGYLRELIIVILVIGLTWVAIKDQNFRDPFYVISGSILSAYFAVKS